jgi:C-terminal processing protease CtpA/Prc
MSLSYEGIGASLQLVDDYVTITNILPGGPAAAAGTLKPNDRIMAVGQGHDGALTDVDRLAARRRGAADPRQGRHGRAAADPARRRGARHRRSAPWR